MQKTIFFKIVLLLLANNCWTQSEILPRVLNHFNGFNSSFLPKELISDSIPKIYAHIKQANHVGLFRKVKSQDISTEYNSIGKSSFNISANILNDQRGPYITTTWAALGISYGIKISDKSKITTLIEMNNVAITLDNKEDFRERSSKSNVSSGFFVSFNNLRLGLKLNYMINSKLKPLTLVSNILPFNIFHCAILNTHKKVDFLNQINFVNHSLFKDFYLESKLKYKILSGGVAASYKKGLTINLGINKIYNKTFMEIITSYTFPLTDSQIPQISTMSLALVFQNKK